MLTFNKQQSVCVSTLGVMGRVNVFRCQQVNLSLTGQTTYFTVKRWWCGCTHTDKGNNLLHFNQPELKCPWRLHLQVMGTNKKQRSNRGQQDTWSLMYKGYVRTKKWRTHFFTSTTKCIKSEMTVEMCGASHQLQGCRTHFSTAVDSLATLRGDVGKLL